VIDWTTPEVIPPGVTFPQAAENVTFTNSVISTLINNINWTTP
jgi:hypothetical protein